MEKIWEIKKYENVTSETVKEYAKKYNLNEMISEILIKRNINQIEKYISPTRNDFHDPYKINDMEKAVERINKAIDEKEKVCIYGDYDVDGITSTAVLKQYLEERGLIVEVYVPDRINEGYGVNIGAIDKVIDKGVTLLITVDCGITSTLEVEYANTKKLDVIITDHHEPKEELPKALAVIDNKRKDSKYPFKELAGVGVVFKLIQAISIKRNLKAEEYLKYLDIVCIGTICDIVPLVDENRVIAKLGLMLLSQTRNMGLQELLKLIGNRKLDSTTIGFGIGPRINACGRIGEPKDALRLLCTKDLAEAKMLAEMLDINNQRRQKIEKNIYDEAVNEVETKMLDDKVLVIAKENWHHGVIGIVASKITEKYFKPTIILDKEELLAKGSGRSIKGFNLHKALLNCQDKILKFGGHAMAIGIQINVDDLDSLKKLLVCEADKNKIEKLLPVLEIEKELSLSELTNQNVASIEILEPYGEENQMPIFAFRNMKIKSMRTLTEGKHLKLTLEQEGKTVDAIGFGMGNLSEKYLEGDYIDVAGNIEINKFGNKENIQINLKDVK